MFFEVEFVVKDDFSRDLDQAVELIHEWKQCSTKDTNIDAQLKIRENQVILELRDMSCFANVLLGSHRIV